MTPDSRLRTPDFDKRMMSRALELAARGVGQVSPSPLVGCVIVTNSGETIGEGYYLYENLKHAETLALEQSGPMARGGTAYVTLEPHAHYGRTPPCTDALIKAGIKRVVAPIEDPNPKVSGQGFAHLRAAGVEVLTGLMAGEALRLNEKYIHFMRTGRPFVHLKLATSLDGRIATRTGDSRWITGEAARARVHLLRHEYDAILVGSGTARADDPLLTDRSGLKRHRPLTRIILDQQLSLSPDSQLARTAHQSPVLVYSSNEHAPSSTLAALKASGVEIAQPGNGSLNLQSLLQDLGARGIQSLLVEGGAQVAGSFLDAGLIEKASFFIAPMIIGGTDAPASIAGTGARHIADATRLRDIELKCHGPDLEITGYPVRSNESRGKEVMSTE